MFAVTLCVTTSPVALLILSRAQLPDAVKAELTVMLCDPTDYRTILVAAVWLPVHVLATSCFLRTREKVE